MEATVRLPIDWLPWEVIHASMLMLGSRTLARLGSSSSFFRQLVPRVVSEACARYGALHLTKLHGLTSLGLSLAEERFSAVMKELTKLKSLIKRGKECAGAIHGLRMLLGESGVDGGILIAAGVVEPFIRVLKSGGVKDKHAAARALRKLVVGWDERKAILAHAGVIEPLVELLKHGDVRGKGYAAFALGALADRSEERMAAMSDHGAIPALVQLLATGEVWDQRAAATTLGSLADRSEVRSQEAVDGGAIPLLVALLEGADAKGRKAPAFALGSLAVGSQERCSMIIAHGAVPTLVELLQNGDPEDKGYASRALLHLLPCQNMRATQASAIVATRSECPIPDDEFRDKLQISKSR